MTTGETRLSKPQNVGMATSRRPVCTAREDLVTAVFAACTVGGLLADAWAHSNIVDTIESFFTPWHGLLYGGFFATAAWTFWLGLRRRGNAPRKWREDWPVGYALGAMGAIGFLVGGLLDMIWHSIFGTEVNLEIAFSPSHLLLSFSGLFLLTSPVRSWWATGEGGLRAVAGVLSLALGTVFGSVLLTAFSAFRSTAPTMEYDHVQGSASDLAASLGIASYLITTLVLALPLLLAHQRRPTPGTATAIVAISGLFACITQQLPANLTAAASGAIIGAALTDLAMRRLDATRGHDAALRLPIAGALFATLVWTGHLLGLHLTDGLRWPAELATGSVAFAAVIATALGVIAQRPDIPAGARKRSGDAGRRSMEHIATSQLGWESSGRGGKK
jgi:hypothetical protein